MNAATVGQELLSNRRRIVGFVALILRETHLAEDVFQEVVVRALEDSLRFESSDHLIRWALRVARHRAVDLARARERLVLDDGVYGLLEDEACEMDAGTLETRLRTLRLCLAALPSKARRLVRLRYGDSLPGNEVAERLGTTPAAVYQAFCRLHEQLRKCIETKLSGQEGPVRA